MRIRQDISQLHAVTSDIAPRIGPRPKQQAVTKEIEARFCVALLDAAMPKGKALFGSAVSGSVARERFIEQVARAIADVGALGIVKATGVGASVSPAGADDQSV